VPVIVRGAPPASQGRMGEMPSSMVVPFPDGASDAVGRERPLRALALPPLKSPRLLDQVRKRVRGLHCSLGTEEAYVFWCRAFIRHHGLHHPSEMGGPKVEAFLTHLAAARGLSVSSHRQALSALLFLYWPTLPSRLTSRSHVHLCGNVGCQVARDAERAWSIERLRCACASEHQASGAPCQGAAASRTQVPPF